MWSIKHSILSEHSNTFVSCTFVCGAVHRQLCAAFLLPTKEGNAVLKLPHFYIPLPHLRSPSMNIVTRYTLAGISSLSLLVTSAHYASKGWQAVESTCIQYVTNLTQYVGASILPYTGLKDPTLPLPMDLNSIIDREAAAQGLRRELIDALIEVESTGKKSAIAKNPEQEAKGVSEMLAAAHSYMQVQGRHAGTTLCPEAKDWSDLYIPEINIRCGIRILKYELQTYQSVYLALGAYNGGPRAIKDGRIIFEESRQHAERVMISLAQKMWNQ